MNLFRSNAKVNNFMIKWGAEMKWLATVLTDLRDDLAVSEIVANTRDFTQGVADERKIKDYVERLTIALKSDQRHDLGLDF